MVVAVVAEVAEAAAVAAVAAATDERTLTGEIVSARVELTATVAGLAKY
jgi:hypothetical protein